MFDLEKLLMRLDQRLVQIFKDKSHYKNHLEKTDNINIAGDRSLKVDIIMEEAIIDFFKEEEFPCIIEAEEKGRTVISDTPKFLVISDPLDGSNNLQRGIPLVCYGVAIAKIPEEGVTPTFKDIEVATVRSLFSNEFFFAQKGQGAYCNGQVIHPSSIKKLSGAMISYDLDRVYHKRPDLVNAVLKVVKHCKGTRRFGANLLDIAYVGAGKIEAMIDIRNKLSAVHISSIFISKESGAVILAPDGLEFQAKLLASENMNLILSNNQELMAEILRLLKDG